MSKSERDSKNLEKERFFKKSIYFFISITPLIFIFRLANAFDLPKFIWIFFICYFMGLYFLISQKQKVNIKKKNFVLPLSFFLIWGLFTGIKSINIFETLNSTFILFLFLNFYFFATEIFEKEDIEKILKTLLLASLIIPVYGFFQVLGIDFFIWNIQRSPLSTLGRRNNVGEYYVMIIPFVCFFIQNSKCLKEKIFFIFLLILFLIHLFLTFTRASYIGFFVSFLLFLFLLKIQLPFKKIVLVILLFLLCSNLVAYSGLGFERGTVKSRIFIWAKTFKMIRENPIIGVGLGNFKINFLNYAEDRPKQFPLLKEFVEDVHNDFLEILVETGIIGFCIFIFLLLQIFRTSIFIIKESSQYEKVIIYGILSSIVGLLVNACASFPFKKPSTLLLFYLNLSFLDILYPEKHFYKIKVSKNLLKFFLFLFFTSGTIISYRSIMGNYYYKKAKDNPFSLPKTAEISIKYNPFNYKTYFILGDFYLNKGNLNSALYYFKKAEVLFPYFDGLHNNLGIIYFKKGKYKDAEKHFLLSLKLNKYRIETYNNLGALYIEKGEVEKAIEYLEKGKEIDNSFYLLYFNLGIAYLEKNDRKKAEENFKKVLDLKPDFQLIKPYLR